jgi:hypothetical protein
VATTEEVIADHLERMKDPDISRKAFDDLAQRVKRLQALARER